MGLVGAFSICICHYCRYFQVLAPLGRLSYQEVSLRERPYISLIAVWIRAKFSCSRFALSKPRTTWPLWAKNNSITRCAYFFRWFVPWSEVSLPSLQAEHSGDSHVLQVAI